MEIKTLKDIEFGRSEKEDREMLRSEAKKWFQIIDDDTATVPITRQSGLNDHDANVGITTIMAWIKHFFNLEDE